MSGPPMAEKQRIIGITGYSAAGKSTAAKYIGESLSIPYYCLGTREREIYGHLGTPPEYYKKLGISVYYGMYGEHINQIAARISGSGIILESFYAKSFVDLLGKAFPSASIKVVHISAPFEKRVLNLASKIGGDAKEAARQLEEIDAVKVGLGLLEMIRMSDATVENSGSLPAFLRRASETVAPMLR